MLAVAMVSGKPDSSARTLSFSRRLEIPGFRIE